MTLPSVKNGSRISVLVIGGGASGVLLAAQLLRRGREHVAVTIVEKGAMLGCGIAYSTSDPQHLLNTRVANMSAYPDEPDHFLDWLRMEEKGVANPHGFVPRGTYRRYLQSLLDPWAQSPALSCLHAECLRLDLGSRSVTAQLAGGRRLEANLAVLATGHTVPGPMEIPGVSQPWAAPAIPSEGDMLMVGSGLTMVDQVLSLLGSGHEGRITAVSRRGLLPQVHQPTVPMAVRADDLPRPMRIATLMRWLRQKAREQEARGGDWRDAVDGLRPHLQTVWRELPLASRQSFLRHASSHWEVHRHRMPPESHDHLREAQRQGRLRLLRGRFETVETTPDGGLLARVAGPDGRTKVLPVSRVIDCRGVRRDPERHATPLVASLLAAGTARIDPLRLGLDVTPDCAVRSSSGSASERLFALGPASRAAFWEITAIPDIRSQAALLADRIVAHLNPTGPEADESAQGQAAKLVPIVPTPSATESVLSAAGEESSPSTRRRSRDRLPKGRSLEWPEPSTSL